VRTEGDDAAAATGCAFARCARCELVEFALQRPARAQQFDRIVVRADQYQLQLRGQRREAREVARDVFGQCAGLRLCQAVACHVAAGREFQCQCAEYLRGHGRVVVAGSIDRAHS
jgi:hypothetical protein